MIRFVHTADIHFGMENYGKIDPTTGIHTRLLDFAQALHFCIDRAISEQVDFFLFCGDAYKTAHPSQTQQKLLLQCFLRLHKAGIPIVIVIGNHDNPLSFGKAHALDIFDEIPVTGFYVIEKPQIITLHTKNGPVQIVGIPWPTRNTITLSNKHAESSAIEITQYISQAVTRIIQDFAKKLDPQIPAVLAGHLTVSSGVFSGSEKRAIYGTDPLFMPSQLAIDPFDYVALGHLHRYQNLNPNGYPAIVYAGSIERVDFGERKEDKGFCLVTIQEKGSTDHVFIKTPTRPFIQIEIHLEPHKSQTQQIIEKIESYPIDDAVIKIMYHLQTDQQDTVDLKAIYHACIAAHYVVGIIPIKPLVTRERRTAHIHVGMDFTILLEHYFDTKQEYASKKEELLEKALLLYDQAMHEHEASD